MPVSTFFEPIPAGKRREALEAYAAHLLARDGRPDVAARRLPHREAAVAALAPDRGRFAGRIAREPFVSHVRSAHLAGNREGRTLPRELVLVFACVRVNAYEAYSVEQLIDTAPFDEASLRDRVNVMVMLEEYYHTRFLLSIADLFELPVPFTPEPPLPVKAVVASLRYTPTAMVFPLTLASELVGLSLFVTLLERTRTIFAAEPEIRDAMEARICEVITDEMGHISFNRMQCGRAGLRVAQALLPIMAAGTRTSLPGTEAIGMCPHPFSAIRDLDPQRMPESVRRRAFIV